MGRPGQGAQPEQLGADHPGRVAADAVAKRQWPEGAGGRVLRDAGDRSVPALAETHRLAGGEQAIHELRPIIEEAPQRLGRGTYGQGIGWGEAIASQRLEVGPTVGQCIECQSLWDRRPLRGARHATPGRPVVHAPAAAPWAGWSGGGSPVRPGQGGALLAGPLRRQGCRGCRARGVVSSRSPVGWR
ncbi:MAG: hypothetical protein NZ890_13610 [Myxococcota bacterium]|nr:hypothetical protein [Myxococcota bacterium]